MKKKRKSVWSIIGIYCVIGMIITLGMLTYINNVLLSDQNSIKVTDNTKVNNQVNLQVDVPGDATLVNQTYDGSYVVYLENGKINIVDAKKNKKLDPIDEKYDVSYAEPLADRNIVIFFVYYKGQMYVKTYNIDSKEMTTHNNFAINNFESVKDVRYSSLTNMIYLNVEKKIRGITTNYIYKINIMKHVNTYVSGKVINSIALLNNSDSLVYEDSNNNIFINNKKYSYNKKLKLLGIDSNDNIYLSEKNDLSKIIVLKDNQITSTINIKDANYKCIYNKNNNLFLIYDKYVYNVMDNKTMNIDKGTNILNITNENVLYRNTNSGKIFIKSINYKN